ncbi:HNH endonuclease [Brasilonema sp. UFV-L1]|uniref:HNH endonuclease n=1 Tax=Brasilonema sp. UFV-L1 TaxID=2234130 RepID=UPI00145C3ACA
MRGKNNGRYVHGDCRGKYSYDFNRRVKSVIRHRDRYTCLLCGMTEREHGLKLHVHHVDYDKTNSSVYNLITLCKYCHGKMHGSIEQRETWKKELLRLLGASIRRSRLTT